MKELSYDSLGIHFNNAVVISEEQFQILMDFMNEMKSEISELKTETHKIGEQIRNVDPESGSLKIKRPIKNVSKDTEDLPLEVSEVTLIDDKETQEETGKYTVEDLLKQYTLGSNKKFKYVIYVRDPAGNKRTVQGQQKTAVLEKAVRIMNGEKPPHNYNMVARNKKKDEKIQKMVETKVPEDFNSWKEYWKTSLEAANGRPPFKPVFDQLKKVYGLNVYEEAKLHGYKKSEVLEALFYTEKNRSLFEACAGSFLATEKKPKVVTIDFDPDRYGQDLATATGGKYGLSSILSTMYTQYKVDWKSAQTVNQKKERLKRDPELREKFVKSYNKLRGVM